MANHYNNSVIALLSVTNKFKYKGKINFFLEDYKIRDCPFNSNWIIKSYGKEEFETIAEKTILSPSHEV